MHFVLRARFVASSHFEGSDLVLFCLFFFSKVSTEDSSSHGCYDIGFNVLPFLRFTLETDVEVDEGSERDWFFTTSCLRLTGWLV